MKRFIPFLLLILSACSARAADKITALVEFSRFATNGDTITVNGVVKTYTNNVTAIATQIATNASIGGTATNTFSHYLTQPASGVNVLAVNGSGVTITNGVLFAASCGSNLTVTLSSGLGTVTSTTNVCQSGMVSFRVPLAGEPSAVRINNASLAAKGVSDYSTNSFSESSIALSNFFGLTRNYTISGSNTFSGTNLFSHPSNTFIGTHSGHVGGLTNGWWTNAQLRAPSFSNAVNYGNAFSSPGLGSASEQFGSGADATTNNATALGADSNASGESSIAIGYASSASANSAMAIGQDSVASGQGSVAVGPSSLATNLSTVAIGASSTAGYTNSVAIGSSATTEANNQMMLGSASVDWVKTFGRFEAGGGITNGHFTGTNNWSGDLSFIRTNVTSIANGANAAIPTGNKVNVTLIGATAAFSTDGFDGGRDGRILLLENPSGQSWTIPNESGVEPTAANRIITGIGASVTITNNPGAALLKYNSASNRWMLSLYGGTAVAGLGSVSNVGGGFGVFDSNAGSVAQLRSHVAGNGFSYTTNSTNIIGALSAAIDIGTNTSLEIPNSAAPATTVFGQIAGDNNAWAASRGAVQFFDGTLNTWLVGVLTNDAPSNGQVPKWNTGGTITWEDDNNSGGANSFTVISTNNFTTNHIIAPSFDALQTNGTKRAIINISGQLVMLQSVNSEAEVWLVVSNSVTTTGPIVHKAPTTDDTTSADSKVPFFFSATVDPGAIWYVTNVLNGANGNLILGFQRTEF